MEVNAFYRECATVPPGGLELTVMKVVLTRPTKKLDQIPPETAH